MLDALISSKTRIKLLVRLFLNPKNSAHLRGLAEEFAESTNSVRLELNRFEDAGMIISETSGNKKLFRANNKHPLYKDLNNILLKYIGLDRIIDTVIDKLGSIYQVYLSGDYAQGIDSGIIDLILIGDVDKAYLVGLVAKAEMLIGKKIRYLTYMPGEWDAKKERELATGKALLMWETK